MQKISYTFLVFILLNPVIITGCNNFDKKQPIIIYKELPSNEVLEDQLNNLMLEYASIMKKETVELEKIYLHAKEKFEIDSSTHNRFRYILFLILSNQNFYDRDKALTLLTNWPESEQLTLSSESFRQILIMRLTEEIRLRNQVRDLSHQLANEKLNAEVLQKKIDDIKNMEKSLIRRNLQ